MNTGLLTVVAIWVGAVAAVLIPIVYGLGGNHWWETGFGRGHLLLHAVLGLVYLRSIISVAKHRVPTSVSWDTWAITVLMAVALVVYLGITIVLTVRGRVANRRENRTRGIRSEAS